MNTNPVASFWGAIKEWFRLTPEKVAANFEIRDRLRPLNYEAIAGLTTHEDPGIAAAAIEVLGRLIQDETARVARLEWREPEQAKLLKTLRTEYPPEDYPDVEPLRRALKEELETKRRHIGRLDEFGLSSDKATSRLAPDEVIEHATILSMGRGVEGLIVTDRQLVYYRNHTTGATRVETYAYDAVTRIDRGLIHLKVRFGDDGWLKIEKRDGDLIAALGRHIPALGRQTAG